jgi:hypothetical protein
LAAPETPARVEPPAPPAPSPGAPAPSPADVAARVPSSEPRAPEAAPRATDAGPSRSARGATDATATGAGTTAEGGDKAEARSAGTTGGTQIARADGPPPLRDPRALARRALDREVAGDRAGAIADVRAALALETDPAHRASLENFLRLLE